MEENKNITQQETPDIRDAIISDDMSVGNVTESVQDKSESPEEGEKPFYPFNYEKEEGVSGSVPSKGARLKEGDVIKISKAKLKELNIDPDKIKEALKGNPDDYTKDKIVSDEDRTVLNRESNIGIAYTESTIVPEPGKSSILVDLDKVTISDKEKEDFLRSTLAGEPYTYKVTLKNGAIEINLKAKNLGLQQTSLSMMPWLLRQKNTDGTPVYDYNSMFLWVTKAEIILTTLSFAGKKLFKFMDMYDPNVKLTEQELFDMLKEDMEKIDRLPLAVWKMLLNGCRIREQKEKLLNEYIVNEDF